MTEQKLRSFINKFYTHWRYGHWEILLNCLFEHVQKGYSVELVRETLKDFEMDRESWPEKLEPVQILCVPMSKTFRTETDTPQIFDISIYLFTDKGFKTLKMRAVKVSGDYGIGLGSIRIEIAARKALIKPFT